MEERGGGHRGDKMTRRRKQVSVTRTHFIIQVSKQENIMTQFRKRREGYVPLLCKEILKQLLQFMFTAVTLNQGGWCISTDFLSNKNEVKISLSHFELVMSFEACLHSDYLVEHQHWCYAHTVTQPNHGLELSIMHLHPLFFRIKSLVKIKTLVKKNT